MRKFGWWLLHRIATLVSLVGGIELVSSYDGGWQSMIGGALLGLFVALILED